MPVQQSWDDTNTRTYNIQPFTKIYLEGAFKVILEQGTQSGLRIKTDEDNFKYIDVQSDTQTLNLKFSISESKLWNQCTKTIILSMNG